MSLWAIIHQPIGLSLSKRNDLYLEFCRKKSDLKKKNDGLLFFVIR